MPLLVHILAGGGGAVTIMRALCINLFGIY